MTPNPNSLSPRFALTRRGLLVTGAAAAASAASIGSVAFAQGAADRRLIVVILRGGLDGLAAVPPVGQPAYAGLRGAIAIPAEAALPLGDGLGLHPALAGFSRRFGAGTASILHAAATPYRERSHFDGQDVLESGSAGALSVRDGWLNRALAAMPSARDAVGVGAALPLILSGDVQVATWSPEVLPGPDADTIARLQRLYAEDALLGPALDAALELDAIASDMSGMPAMQGRVAGRPAGGGYQSLATAAARLMAAPGGPTIAALSFEDWDTHANQGGLDGALAQRLRGLDAAIDAMETTLGPDLWATTVVLVATEFGRTVRVNGGRGTDHGTGGAAFVLGGAVKSSRLLGDWPGLDRLYEGRDLWPANDLRALFKGVLRDHLGLDRAALDTAVFPGSADVAGIDGLV